MLVFVAGIWVELRSCPASFINISRQSSTTVRWKVRCPGLGCRRRPSARTEPKWQTPVHLHLGIHRIQMDDIWNFRWNTVQCKPWQIRSLLTVQRIFRIRPWQIYSRRYCCKPVRDQNYLERLSLCPAFISNGGVERGVVCVCQGKGTCARGLQIIFGRAFRRQSRWVSLYHCTVCALAASHE